MGYRWKPVAKNEPTGQLDKNGLEICLGDQIKYRRKIKTKYKSNYRTGMIEIMLPSFYKWVTAKVTGFGRIVRTHYDGKPLAIEYIVVKGSDANAFDVRIYRTDLIEVVTNK